VVERQSLLGRLLISLERADVLIFLMLRNEMDRDIFALGSVKLTLKDTNLWSEIGKSNAEQFRGVTPEQQIRSSICPLECVGKSIYCCNPKLSRHDVKSFVRLLLGLSM